MSNNDVILLSIACAAGFGLIAHIFADRFRVPVIMPLIALGVVLGPDALNWVRPESFGSGLTVFVKLCVSIILFEGALNLRLRDLRGAVAEVRNLVTVGVLVTWAGATALAHYLTGLSWRPSIIFGALVTVTGPTVVQPLLKRIQPPRKLKAILEGEAIFNDPIGAVLAVAVLDVFLSLKLAPASNPLLHIWGYFGRLLVGVGVGVAGGILISLSMRLPRLLRSEVNEAIALVGVWVAVGISEALMSESGIMAAVAMGLIVQRGTVPDERQLRHFKGQLTILGIGMLFVLLAANVRLQDISFEGWAGLGVALALMLVVRPVIVLISTNRSTLTWREKGFLASVAPRGIVAASVASIFALALANAGLADGDRVLALTFIVIVVSVFFSAIAAPLFQRLFNLESLDGHNIVIVGAGPFSCQVGELLVSYGRSVTIVDLNRELVEQARQRGLNAMIGNALEEETLQDAGADDAETLLSMTPNSEVNVLAAQLGHDEFRIHRSYPVLNRSETAPGSKLISGAGGHMAFGSYVALREWEQAIRNGEVRTMEWNVPAGWKDSKVEKTPMPQHLLPVAQIRDGRIEIVACGQKWRTGDKILLLSRLAPSEAMAILSQSAPA